MAVNRKDGSVNSLGSDDDFGLADFGRLEEQYEREPIAMRELRRRAKRAKAERLEMNKLADVSPEVAALPEFKQEVKINTKTTADLENRLRINKIASRERVNAQAVNIVGREYSERAIDSYVTSNANSLGAQVAGANMSWQGYGALSQQRSEIMNQMQGLRQESMGAAGTYMQNHGVNPAAAATIQGNAGQMKELAQQLIPITLAMQQLKQQGLDPQGRQRALINAGDKAGGVLAYNKLEDEMRSGKGLGSLSAGDLRKREQEAAEKLIKALDELRNSAGKTSEELEGLNKNAEDAAKEFEDIGDARKIGPPGGGGYKVGAAWASVVANVANLVGNTIQTMAIDQPMAQMGNIAGYANLENQKYDSWRAGNEGNMTERLNMAGWGNAGEFGRQMANRAGWVLGARVVGGVAATAAGGLQALDAATSAPGGVTVGKIMGNANTVTNIASGAQAVGEGLAMTLITGKDAVQKISTSQAEIAANLQAMGTTRALTHIPGYQLQQYRDYLMHLNKGAQGLGDQAGAFIDQAGGSAFIDRMSGVGLGGAEMGHLSAFGAANMGSTFSADQAIRAKHYENMGFGSAQENMQRMATFAGAGAQNPMQSMEKVLERAVGAGINSSKALNIIADNTGQLVERDSMRGGMDTSGDVSRLILSAIDKNNPNKEFAVRQAAETFKTEEQWKTNTNTSFAGMVALTRMQKDLGLDFASALGMQDTSSSMLTNWAERVKHGDAEKVKQEMFTQGIDVTNNKLFNADPNKFFETTRSNKVLNQLERGGAGWAFGSTQDFAKLKDWIGSNKQRQALFTNNEGLFDESTPQWVREEIKAINQSVARQGGNPLATRRDMAVGLGYLTANQAKLPNEGEMRRDGFGFTQEERSLAERQRNEAMKQGMATIGAQGSSGTTGALAVAATGRTNQALPGANAEARWAEAAAKSAADFGVSAIKLDSASGKLVEAANKLIDFAGANKINKDDEDTRKKIKELQDKMPKLSGDNKTQRIDGAH